MSVNRLFSFVGDVRHECVVADGGEGAKKQWPLSESKARMIPTVTRSGAIVYLCLKGCSTSPVFF